METDGQPVRALNHSATSSSFLQLTLICNRHKRDKAQHLPTRTEGNACCIYRLCSESIDSKIDNDPSAGSPTETLLRLLLPPRK